MAAGPPNWSWACAEAGDYPGSIGALPSLLSRALRLRDQAEILLTRRSRAIAFLEVRGDLVERPVTPPLGFGEQLQLSSG